MNRCSLRRTLRDGRWADPIPRHDQNRPQKVQLADELYRAQPHVLASFLVQNKLGVRPGEMEFLLEPCRSSSMTAADY